MYFYKRVNKDAPNGYDYQQLDNQTFRNGNDGKQDSMLFAGWVSINRGEYIEVIVNRYANRLFDAVKSQIKDNPSDVDYLVSKTLEDMPNVSVGYDKLAVLVTAKVKQLAYSYLESLTNPKAEDTKVELTYNEMKTKVKQLSDSGKLILTKNINNYTAIELKDLLK